MTPCFRSNIDQDSLNIFKAGLNLTLSGRIINDNVIGFRTNRKNSVDSFCSRNGSSVRPDLPTGKYPTNPLVGTRPNPYSLVNNVDRGNTDRLLGNIFIEARPLDGLTLRVNAGIDHISGKNVSAKSTASQI